MSALYPVAVGVIPNLLAIYVQQGLHRPLPYWGNLAASFATLLATIVGWILALKVTIQGTPPSNHAEIIIYLALILPAIGIVLSLTDAMKGSVQVVRAKAQPKSRGPTLSEIQQQLDRIEERLP